MAEGGLSSILFIGSFELFKPVRSEDGFQLDLVNTGNLHTVMKVTAADTSGVSVSIEETFAKSKNILLSAVKHQMEPTDFRPIKGNQCVENAYTLASIYPSPVPNHSVSQLAIPESYIAEIVTRDGPCE